MGTYKTINGHSRGGSKIVKEFRAIWTGKANSFKIAVPHFERMGCTSHISRHS